MLARWNNNEHLGTINYYPTDGILFSICVIFINSNSIWL
jgi:hypothetical protein